MSLLHIMLTIQHYCTVIVRWFSSLSFSSWMIILILQCCILQLLLVLETAGSVPETEISAFYEITSNDWLNQDYRYRTFLYLQIALGTFLWQSKLIAVVHAAYTYSCFIIFILSTSWLKKQPDCSYALWCNIFIDKYPDHSFCTWLYLWLLQHNYTYSGYCTCCLLSCPW